MQTNPAVEQNKNPWNQSDKLWTLNCYISTFVMKRILRINFNNFCRKPKFCAWIISAEKQQIQRLGSKLC